MLAMPIMLNSAASPAVPHPKKRAVSLSVQPVRAQDRANVHIGALGKRDIR